MDSRTYNIDPEAIERLITPATTAILGVHVWGRACDTEALDTIARKNKLKVMYDAAHAFGCSRKGRMVGGFGACEVFSFHATKVINSFEGGAIVTDDDSLAEKVRLMRNFGFIGYDRVVYLGINGKMSEVCAAMGLTSLEAVTDLFRVNQANYECYQKGLQAVPGLSLIQYDPVERNNYQYVVVEVDPKVAPLDRDDLIRVLQAENVLARKYFWPGCHRMEPYCSLQPDAHLQLPVTEKVAARILLLPTGQTVSPKTVDLVCAIIRSACKNAGAVRSLLLREPPQV